MKKLLVVSHQSQQDRELDRKINYILRRRHFLQEKKLKSIVTNNKSYGLIIKPITKKQEQNLRTAVIQFLIGVRNSVVPEVTFICQMTTRTLKFTKQIVGYLILLTYLI